ncbi:hypothetical protein V5O48_008964 [Marasmius crinis-equi]|uniref:Uncharacterized protein n=1 Tax=Marasmius crinis-equi TaxID=585013 RepID=A0ABR3FCR8_9AGAR
MPPREEVTDSDEEFWKEFVKKRRPRKEVREHQKREEEERLKRERIETTGRANRAYVQRFVTYMLYRGATLHSANLTSIGIATRLIAKHENEWPGIVQSYSSGGLCAAVNTSLRRRAEMKESEKLGAQVRQQEYSRKHYIAKRSDILWKAAQERRSIYVAENGEEARTSYPKRDVRPRYLLGLKDDPRDAEKYEREWRYWKKQKEVQKALDKYDRRRAALDS